MVPDAPPPRKGVALLTAASRAAQHGPEPPDEEPHDAHPRPKDRPALGGSALRWRRCRWHGSDRRRRGRSRVPGRSRDQPAGRDRHGLLRHRDRRCAGDPGRHGGREPRPGRLLRGAIRPRRAAADGAGHRRWTDDLPRACDVGFRGGPTGRAAGLAGDPARARGSAARPDRSRPRGGTGGPDRPGLGDGTPGPGPARREAPGAWALRDAARGGSVHGAPRAQDRRPDERGPCRRGGSRRPMAATPSR